VHCSFHSALHAQISVERNEKIKRKRIKKPEAKQDMHRFTVSYAPPMIQFQHPSHEIKTSQHSN
jgi:hypothetical protein